MNVFGITGEAAMGLDRIGAAGENGNAVPALLAVPDCAVTGLPQRRLGKFLLRRLQLLQAHDVRLGVSEPVQQHRKAAIDTLDVERRNLHCRSEEHTSELQSPMYL